MKQSNSRPTAAERARIRRIRASYRKRMLIVGVIFFILGVVAGILVHSWFTGRRDVPTEATQTQLPTPLPETEESQPFDTDLDNAEDVTGGFAVDTEPEPEATAEPTPEPTPEPTATPQPRPKIQVPVTADPEAQPEADAQAAPEEGEAQPEAAAQAAPDEGEAQPETAVQAAPEEGDALPGAEAEPEGADDSEEVQEFDPEEAEVPVEYTMDQETLANPPQQEAPAGEAAPSDGPQVIAVVPFGESYTYTTQVKLDGSARMEADTDPFETLNFTQSMREYLKPSDFADRYSTEYRLQGDEAGAGFDLTLNDYVGTSVIIPQNVIDVGFCSATGETVERGYQLMDKAIGGNYDVVVEPGTTKTLFKRYAYSSIGEEMKYLVVTTYKDGRQEIILFELEGEEPPEAVIVYPIMQKGLKSADVKNMQERLIELGYLKGKADGDFGKGTEAAVKAAQEAFGMEVNGVADNVFQQKLYEGMESKPIPVDQQNQAGASTEG